MKHLYYDINDTNKSSIFGISAKYGNETQYQELQKARTTCFININDVSRLEMVADQNPTNNVLEDYRSLIIRNAK